MTEKPSYRMVDYLLDYPAPHRMMDSVLQFESLIRKDPRAEKLLKNFFDKYAEAQTKLSTEIRPGDELSIMLPKPPPPPYRMMEDIIKVIPYLRENEKEIMQFNENCERAESEFTEEMEKLSQTNSLGEKL